LKYKKLKYYITITRELFHIPFSIPSRMSFNNIIDNVNQSITNIEYHNITNDTYPRYQITIKTKNNLSDARTKFEFCIDNEQNCCEHFGCYYALEKPEIDIYGSVMLSEVEQFIGLNVVNIHIYEIKGSDGCRLMVMKINLEDNKQFHFVMYNFHNGYYPHSVWLNVYENYDTQPMQVLNTCI